MLWTSLRSVLKAHVVLYAADIATSHQRGPRRVGLVVLKLAIDVGHPVQNQPPVGGPHQPYGTHGAPHAHCGNPNTRDGLHLPGQVAPVVVHHQQCLPEGQRHYPEASPTPFPARARGHDCQKRRPLLAPHVVDTRQPPAEVIPSVLPRGVTPIRSQSQKQSQEHTEPVFRPKELSRRCWAGTGWASRTRQGNRF